LAILKIKDVWHQLPTYPDEVGGTDIYAAMLDHGVRTPAQFATYLKDRGVAPDIEIVGEAASGHEAIAQALALQSDVILMGLKMPGINGIEATRRILYASPRIGVLVLTIFETDETVFAAIRAGARGYMLKDADQEEVIWAVKAVSRGEAIFSPAIAKRLIHYFAALKPTIAD